MVSNQLLLILRIPVFVCPSLPIFSTILICVSNKGLTIVKVLVCVRLRNKGNVPLPSFCSDQSWKKYRMGNKDIMELVELKSAPITPLFL